jgi:hypothetical protein
VLGSPFTWLDGGFQAGGELSGSRRQSQVAVVLAAVCGAFMLTVAMRMAGPTVHPDEFGFLSNGQALIGHVEAPIPTGSFYPAGYGIVTGLGALLSGSIAGAYRFALMANLLFAVLTAVFAHRLATRGFGASRSIGLIAACLVFVAPGTVVTAMFAWPETVSRLAFLVFVGAVIGVTRHPSNRSVLLLGLSTGLMPALHGRFTLLLPILCVIFLWWGMIRFIPRTIAIIGVGVTALGYSGSYALNKFVKGALYADAYDQENRLLRRLVDPSVWPALLRTMVGQSWYLIATSFGMVGIAFVFGFLRIKSEGGRKSVATDPARLGMLVLLASSLFIIFTGGLQLLYGSRGDHLIYGRYVEILVPALLVLACVGLERAPRISQRALLFSGLSILIVSFLYVLIDWGDGVKGGYTRNDIVFPNIIGTDIVKYIVEPGLISFGLVFAVGTVCLLVTIRSAKTWGLVLLVAVLGAGSMYSGQRSILSRTDDLEATTETVGLVQDSGTSLVGFDMGVRNDRSYYYLRYKLHPIRLVRFDISSPTAVIPQSYDCVYGFPNKPPTDGEWSIVADERVLQRVLWQRVGAPHC